MEMNNKLTGKQMDELQAKLNYALKFYQKHSGEAAQNMINLLMLANAATEELKAYRKAEASNLFICGVIDDGENCERVGDLEAEFFTVYRQNADGTSEALMDFVTREDAERALKLITASPLQVVVVPDAKRKNIPFVGHRIYNQDGNNCRSAMLKGGAK